MLLKDRVPIFFIGGNYGHYLYWVLNNFTTKGLHSHPKLPFGKSGNSHNQYSNGDQSPFWSEMKCFEDHPYYCLHFNDPGSNIADDELIYEVAGAVDKVIAIKYDPAMQLLTISNWIDKTYNDIPDLIASVKDTLELDTLDNNSSISEIRELLSYKLFNDGYIQRLTALELPNIKVIELNSLLYEFETVISNIVAFLDTELSSPMETILENHNKMMALQSNITKDALIKKFLSDFVNHVDCKLPDACTLIDEAYIQYYLREELNLELRCNDIGDHFPNTSKELWSYT